MSLHRRGKYILTALSLHVWTASNSFAGTSLQRKNPPRHSSPAPDSGHTLSPARHPPREPEKHWRFLFPRTQNRHDSLEKCIKISRQGREGREERERERWGRGGGGGGGKEEECNSAQYLFNPHKASGSRSSFTLDAGVPHCLPPRSSLDTTHTRARTRLFQARAASKS